MQTTVNNCDNQNPLTGCMTACLILASFLGTSAAQPIPADNSTKHQSLAIPQAVCQADPTTMQQQFQEGVTILKLGKRGISESTAEHGTLYCLWYNIIHGMYGIKKLIPFVCHYLLLF